MSVPAEVQNGAPERVLQLQLALPVIGPPELAAESQSRRRELAPAKTNIKGDLRSIVVHVKIAIAFAQLR